MGPLELALVAALALVLFGPDRLPELARQAGRLVAELRRLGAEANAELQRSLAVDSPGVSRPKSPLTGPRSGDASRPVPDSDGPLPPY